MAKRYTKAQIQAHVDRAIELIRENKPYREMVNILVEETERTRSTCETYISKASAQIKAAYQNEDVAQIRAEMIDGYINDLKYAYKEHKRFNRLIAGEYNLAIKWWDRYQLVKEKIAQYYPGIMSATDDDLVINISVESLVKGGKK